MLYIIYSNPKSIEWYGEITKIYVGDNNFNYIKFRFPDEIESFPRSECSVELRAYTTKEHYLSYSLSTERNNVKHPVTLDMTDSARTLKLLLVITHNETVIGFTNALELKVRDSGGGTEISPREGLDRTIAEQAATITRQETEIATKDNTISQQSSQITELNGEVTELQSEVAEQATTITRQNTTIDELNRRVPPLQALDPINPTMEQVTYNPESPNIGFPQVIVNAPTVERLGFREDYYKKDEVFLNKVGTYDPFPYNSVGGIYITEVDEDGYPVKFLIKNYSKAPDPLSPFFKNDALSKLRIKEIVFDSCREITRFSNGHNGEGFFKGLGSMHTLILPEAFEIIPFRMIMSCLSLRNLYLPNSVTTISSNGFEYSGGLETINIPNSIISIGSNAFSYNASLKNVTIENGFNCNNLNLSYSTLYSHDTILSWFNALADRTGETAYTLTIGTTNLNKMTAEEIAIATNKNWNIA